ncbi:MAG TPA: oxidoreductase, partial [Caulobacteraceae bacterium]|nr:oxidoreductase [Caulobacteraceae bacterium]
AAFEAAARRALAAGFEVIEVHAAHGYLLHEFLSPLSNRRADQYGGSLENRMRFPLECFAAMRAVWPADKPMGIRISAEDWVDDGFTTDDAVAFAKELKKIGCDYMCVSTGGLDARQQIPLAPGYQVPFGARVRKEAGMVTRSVGLIGTAAQAEEIVASGQADMIAIGRGAIYDPRWAWHAAEELGVETEYAPKYRAGHPSLRPQLFPHRQK